VRKAVIGALLIGLLFGPATCLAGLAVLLNPAAQASCFPGLSFGAIPHSLSVTTTDGYTFTLNHQQLTHAATIITVGDRTKGVGREGVVIALIAALTESTLEMLSNTSAYPESANHRTMEMEATTTHLVSSRCVRAPAGEPSLT
jgi:hypothetical protein